MPLDLTLFLAATGDVAPALPVDHHRHDAAAHAAEVGALDHADWLSGLVLDVARRWRRAGRPGLRSAWEVGCPKDL